MLAWLRARSRTLGWGAIVSYDQAKTNALFVQQYLRRSSSGQLLPLVSGEVGKDTGRSVYAELSRLTFGPPLLSFEAANLDNAQATARLNLMSGKLVEIERSLNGLRVERVKRIHMVHPAADFWITTRVELKSVQGSVGSQHAVEIDLGDRNVKFEMEFLDEQYRSDGEAFFQRLYADGRLEVRKYQLGSLNLGGNGALTPKTFRIRTQAASEQSRVAGSASYGHGAVVLFVQTVHDEYAGQLPGAGSDFRYLIPNDVDGAGQPRYATSVLISNQILIERLVAPWFHRQCSGLNLVPTRNAGISVLNGSGDAALPVAGYSWSLSRADAMVPPPLPKWYTVNLHNGNLLFPRFVVPYSGYSIRVQDDAIQVNWAPARFTHKFVYTMTMSTGGGVPQWGEVNVDVTSRANAGVRVDQAKGDVIFESPAPQATCAIHGSGLWSNTSASAREQVRLSAVSKVAANMDAARRFSFPEVNTFALNNLLFPEENAVQVSAAYVPGDLALFGQLDPERTSIRVEPLQASVPGGQAQQFSVHSVATRTNNATWRVVAVDGGAPLGSIDQSGRYQAPPKAQLPPTTVRELVEVTVGAGSDAKRASAMVVLVPDALALNPSFTRVVAGSPDAVSVLASTFGGSGAVSWSLEDAEFGGELRPNGNTVTYTAPERLPAGKVLAVQTIRATVGSAVARCAVLVLRASGLEIEVTPYHVPELAPSASVQLTATYQGESGQWEDVTEHDAVTWSIAGGGGTVSKGRYTAPTTIAEPYAVVCISVPAGLGGYQYGYAVIELNEASRHASPSPPTHLHVVRYGTSSVTLAWSAPTGGESDLQYRIYSEHGMKPWGSDTSATVEGLMPDSRYTFVVRAKDSRGLISEPSNAVTVLTSLPGVTRAEAWPLEAEHSGTITCTAYVFDEHGDPVGNLEVRWTAEGTIYPSPASSVTDMQGRATTSVTSNVGVDPYLGGMGHVIAVVAGKGYRTELLRFRDRGL
ncbi:hypothetical protein WM04_15455 [Burkholderia ubonensis]|nr:hypothetical protein WM04_15455 [Burkholderia ubonensis]